MLVVYNPGHGGEWPGGDPGACSHGIQEDDVAYQIALKCQEYTVGHGQRAILTRGKDEFTSLAEICKRANTSKADLFISIHCNSSVNLAAHGSKTFYYPTSYKGMRAAALAQGELARAGIVPDQGTAGKEFFVIRNTISPAILTEVGFISNDQDRALMTDPLGQNRIAGAIVRGALAWGRSYGLV